ncbi:MAG TPA: YihY/virulence factor BrkB family protein [Gemmatimonadales bacterium]|nr:YihY/virulence factor BrkB family protein [Gemmatimonadales bacterium]
MSAGGGWHESAGGVVRRTLEAAFEDNVPFLASALSFDLLLTAIPFVALLLAVVGYLVEHQIAVHQANVHELLGRFLPLARGARGDAFAWLEQGIGNIVSQRGRLTLIGLPLFLYFSTRLFSGLRIALNDVFDTDEIRPWPVAKANDLAVMLATMSLLVVNALLPAFSSRGAAVVADSFLLDWAYRLSLQLVAFGFSTVLFFLIFKLLPSRRIAWRTALVAATFCAVAFEIAKRLYGLYLARFVTLDRLASDANLIAFFLFFLWTYYMALVFLLGGEIAETYDLVRLRRAQRVALG